MSRELNSSTAHRRRDLEKRLGNVNGAISKAVDALLGDAPRRALRERLATLEAERDEIEAAIADVVPPAVEFHPNAANVYRDKIRGSEEGFSRLLRISERAAEPLESRGALVAG